MSGEVLADLLDLTARRVQQLATKGVMHRLGRDDYDLKASIHGYIAFLKSERPQLGAPAAGSLDEQKLRILAIKEEEARLQLEAKRFRMYSADFVADELVERLAPVAGALDNMPSALAMKLENRDAATVLTILDEWKEDVKTTMRSVGELDTAAMARELERFTQAQDGGDDEDDIETDDTP